MKDRTLEYIVYLRLKIAYLMNALVLFTSHIWFVVVYVRTLNISGQIYSFIERCQILHL